jgi:hypothetical protein
MYNGVSGGAHCPCAARNAAEGLNDQNFTKSARISNLCFDRRLQNFGWGGRDATHQARAQADRQIFRLA